MTARVIARIQRCFNVDFIDYERDGQGIMISSGAGIAMGLMDVISSLSYMIDLDMYRNRDVDWETLGCLLGLSSPTSVVVMAGWFTIDTPRAFNAIERGLKSTNLRKLHVYRGGSDMQLGDFISSVRDA